MERRDPYRAHTWVIVTDGERALQHRVTKIFDDVTLVLDLLHVLDKLWKAAHVFHSEGTPEAIAFAQARTERILGGGVSQVVKGLRQMSTKPALRGTRAKTIQEVTAYLYANREHALRHLPLEWAGPSPAAPSKALARTSFAAA